MKTLLLIFLTASAFARTDKKYLVPCFGDNSKLCEVWASVTPRDAICQVPDSKDTGDLYKVEIKKREPGFIDRAKELVGLDADLKRDWSKDETIEPDETIVCTIDEVKKQARLDAIEAERVAEQAKKAKKKSDWSKACRGSLRPVELVICEEKGY